MTLHETLAMTCYLDDNKVEETHKLQEKILLFYMHIHNLKSQKKFSYQH